MAGRPAERTIDRALKALNLVLQAGGFGVVAIDLADVPPAALRQIPFTTWLRVQRAIEGSDTACVLLTSEPLARSAGGLTVSLTGRRHGPGHPIAAVVSRASTCARASCRRASASMGTVSLTRVSDWRLIVFGVVYAAEGSAARRAGVEVAREFSPRIEIFETVESRPRSERSDASVRRREDDRRGAASHGRRSRSADPRGDRGHAHRRAPDGPPSRRDSRSSSLEPKPQRSLHSRSRCSARSRCVDGSNPGLPNQLRSPTPRRSSELELGQLPPLGSANARAIWRRCRPMMWRHVWGRLVCAGSGSRAVRTPLRWCRPSPRSASSSRSISSGRSRSSSRWPSCWVVSWSRSKRISSGAAAALPSCTCVSVSSNDATMRGGTSAAREVHERSLQLPTPIRDARTLRTLALLDLESHPPAGPIDRVVVAVDPTPARIVQFSLHHAAAAVARTDLHAHGAAPGADGGDALRVAGAGRFVEARRVRDDAIRAGVDANVLHPGITNAQSRRSVRLRSPIRIPRSVTVKVALRRFRHPVPARVRVADGKPVRVTIDRRGFSGGGVAGCAGPWRRRETGGEKRE